MTGGSTGGSGAFPPLKPDFADPHFFLAIFVRAPKEHAIRPLQKLVNARRLS
jgi:hypothetical protein